MTTSPTVLLAGCGRWGTRILHSLATLRRPLEVLIDDPAPRHRLGGGRLGVTEADYVVIATPSDSGRADQLRAAIVGGALRVRLEKPIAATAAEIAEILEVAEMRRDVEITSGLQMLATSSVDVLRGLVASSDALWRFRAVRQARQPAQSADAFADLAPHDLALLLELFGELHVDGDEPDEDGVRLLGQRVEGSLSCSWTTGPPVRRLDLAGERGLHVVYDEISDQIRVTHGGRTMPTLAIGALHGAGDRLARSLAMWLDGDGPSLVLGAEASRLALAAAEHARSFDEEGEAA